MTELMLADLDVLEKRRDRAHKLARSNDADAKLEFELVREMAAQLGEGKIPTYDKNNPKVAALVKSFELLTLMPAFVCAEHRRGDFQEFRCESQGEASGGVCCTARP